MFLFSVIWSICITCNTECRRTLDQYLKKVLDGSVDNLLRFQANKNILPPKFDRGLIFDYVYEPNTNEWKHWMDDVNKDEIDNFPRDAKV